MIIDFQSTIFSKKKTLLIESESIQILNKSNDSIISKIKKENIKGIRFGISWIEGYKFTIGRNYIIELKGKSDELLKIKLTSIYSVKRKELGEKYITTLNTILDNYFHEIYNEYLLKIENNIPFQIESVYFSDLGIKVKNNNELIEWKDLELASFQHYISLTSKINSKNYTQLYYLLDWNTFLIEVLAEHMLKE